MSIKTATALKLGFLFLILLAIIVEISTITSEKSVKEEKKDLIATLAKQVLSKCNPASHRPSCYDEEIPKLMDSISMEEAFLVTKLVQGQDSAYAYCHVLGHELSANETKKNPSLWKKVVTRCPSGMCSNGCIHGAFQERFRAEALTDEEIEKSKIDFMDICEKRDGWNPTGLEQASCYHALGHLMMYITNAEINKATELCEEIAIKDNGRDWSHLCFDGAYMQIFQPLEPEDFALIKGKQPKKEELASFCAKFSDERLGSCWSEGWPLFAKEIRTSDGLVQFCSYLARDSVEHDRCYNALFYVLTAQFNFDEVKIKTLCSGLPEERLGQCFANASSRLIETDYRNADKSVSLCKNAELFGQGTKCWEELLFYSTYNFHPGSVQFIEYCQALPEVWSQKCLNRSR